MKFFISIFFIITISYAKVYYAKVEPFELREISSNISGLVVYADENLIGKRLADKPYIKIDSEIDQKDLKSVKEKLVYIKSIIEINEAVLVNLEESLSKSWSCSRSWASCTTTTSNCCKPLSKRM